MRCAKCGAENPAGKRFCGDCGAALENRCAQCGAENPPEKKFCGDCGAALASHAPVTQSQGASRERSRGGINVAERVRVQTDGESPIEGERKTVTALFADIKGSTE